MQLALGALGSIGSALTGGGAAAASAASAVGTAAAGGATAVASSGFSIGGILKGVISGVSALASLSQTDAQAEQFEAQAFSAEQQAQDERAQGLQRTSEIKRQMNRALGENAVKFAAAGIDLSGGVADDNARSIEDRATDEISIDRADTDARRAVLRARAAGYRRTASRTRSVGRLTALTGFGASLVQGFS